MLKMQIEKIKSKLNSNHKKITTMKIYSNNTPVNDVLSIIREKVDVRLRGSVIAVYYALEGHANAECIVNVGQQTLATELGYSREWVNHIISILSEIGLIEKVRRGLNMVNQYTLTVKKNLMDLINKLKELYIQIQKEKKKKNYEKKSSWKYEGRGADYYTKAAEEIQAAQSKENEDSDFNMEEFLNSI